MTKKEGDRVNAKSIMGIMMLAAAGPNLLLNVKKLMLQS